MSTLATTPPLTDAITTARDHIATALRVAANVETMLRAYDCSDDYGLPNDGTAIREELTLALEALGGGASS
jgi:hypothetical protein